MFDVPGWGLPTHWPARNHQTTITQLIHGTRAERAVRRRRRHLAALCLAPTARLPPGASVHPGWQARMAEHLAAQRPHEARRIVAVGAGPADPPAVRYEPNPPSSLQCCWRNGANAGTACARRLCWLPGATPHIYERHAQAAKQCAGGIGKNTQLGGRAGKRVGGVSTPGEQHSVLPPERAVTHRLPRTRERQECATPFAPFAHMTR